MPDARRHPYHMYEAIRAQPLLIENVLARRSEIEKIADAVAKKDRITFVGIGTSLVPREFAKTGCVNSPPDACPPRGTISSSCSTTDRLRVRPRRGDRDHAHRNIFGIRGSFETRPGRRRAHRCNHR